MIRRLLDRVIDGAMILAEIAITLMMAHITVELIVRWLFRYGLDAVPEIVAYYYMTALTFFALAYVTRGDGHISAEIFTQNLAPRAREILEGVIALALCIFMLVFTWQTVSEAISMTNAGETHQAARTMVPKWPARWYLPIGTAIMAAYALLLAVQKLSGGAAAAAAHK